MSKILQLSRGYILLLLVALSACTTGTWDNRNNTDISDNIIPIDSKPYVIGSAAKIYVSDSIIIIKDAHSKDKILTALDPYSNRFKGQFATFGPGPDEITIPGAVVIDNSCKSAYIFDHGQLKIASFNIDSALHFVDYCPVTIGRITNGYFPDRYIHVNDTLGYARSIKIDPKTPGYEQGICRYNLTTGELVDFESPAHIKGLKSLFGVSVTDSIVVEGCTNNDLINIYDFNGKLLHKIKGPQYSDNVYKDKIFFREITITPRHILAGYSGRSTDRKYFADKIIVLDHNGKYITTLNAGKDISDMGYHSPLDRLYLILDDEEMQFAYINLKDVLK